MSFLDDYEPVEDRLRDFWSQHEGGRVITELVHHGTAPGDVIVFRCECYREGENEPASVGYAHQRLRERPPMGRNGKPNESAPEWTSPWEVAETSAIGRALANLGYAAKGKRPSREEISKASNRSSGPGTNMGKVGPGPDEPTVEPASTTPAAETDSGGTVTAPSGRESGSALEPPRTPRLGGTAGPHMHRWTTEGAREGWKVCEVEGCLAAEKTKARVS